MEEQGSSVGNQFQQLTSTSYAAIKPVAVVPGNHVSFNLNKDHTHTHTHTHTT